MCKIRTKNSDTLNLFYLLGDYYEAAKPAKQLKNWGCNQWRVDGFGKPPHGHSQTLHGWFIASESGQTAAGRTICFETMELKDSRYSLFSHFCSGEPMLYTYTILGEIYLWYACCCCTCELVLNVAGIHMNCLPSSMIFLIDYLDLSRLPSSIPSGNMAVENPRTKWSLNGGLKLGKSWKIIHTWNTFHCHLRCPEGSNTICKPSSQEAHHAVFCSVQYPHYISSPLSHPIPMSKSTWCLVHYGSTKLIYLYTYSASLQRFWGNMQKSSGWLEFHQLQWRWFGQGSENTSLYGDVEKWPTLDMPKRADSCQFALLFILRFVVINPICMRIKPQCWKK